MNGVGFTPLKKVTLLKSHPKEKLALIKSDHRETVSLGKVTLVKIILHITLHITLHIALCLTSYITLNKFWISENRPVSHKCPSDTNNIEK